MNSDAPTPAKAHAHRQQARHRLWLAPPRRRLAFALKSLLRWRPG